jgi:hypothetical protein
MSPVYKTFSKRPYNLNIRNRRPGLDRFVLCRGSLSQRDGDRDCDRRPRPGADFVQVQNNSVAANPKLSEQGTLITWTAASRRPAPSRSHSESVSSWLDAVAAGGPAVPLCPGPPVPGPSFSPNESAASAPSLPFQLEGHGTGTA